MGITMVNTMDNYVDIHSHILYGIDDGSKSLEESIEIIKEHIKMGFTDIAVTPHYIENSKYITNNEEKENILKTLKNELKKQNIKINLYIGNEVYINNNIEELLNQNEISTINNTKYLLIELPMQNKIKNISEIIYELRIKGIIPIIAHPERYEYVQKDINYVDKLIEEGALLQSNYASILGMYGEKSKKALKKLLKQNKILILSTDVHYPNSKIYLNMDKIRKKLSKLIGEEKLKELTTTNPKKIIKNEKLEY